MRRGLFFSRPSGPSGPRGRRAYAIGDIHGCLDLLETLLGRIEDDIAESPRAKVSMVFLGDVIDRGPHSAEVIERLRTYSHPRATTHFVMGNHEEVMLRVIEGEKDVLSSWLRFGGAETLKSYGLKPREIVKMGDDERIAALREAIAEKMESLYDEVHVRRVQPRTGRLPFQLLREAIPLSHRKFLAGFSDSISFGDYLFVHAGIRPGVGLSEQSQSDLRWIRDPFLDDPTDHGFVVVHGHTISNTVDVAPNRIGIDTGAFCTGVLTALCIEGPNRWLLQTSDTERRPV